MTDVILSNFCVALETNVMRYITNVKKCTSEIQGNLYNFIKGLTESEGVELWIGRIDCNVTVRFSIAQGVLASKLCIIQGSNISICIVCVYIS